MERTIESPEIVGVDAARLERIKPVMQSYVDKRGFSGISTLLARHNQVIHFEQVGWQDRESHTPLSAETIYRIYSMTKPIVCVALMTLFEQGRFQLFDPVAKFIPGFAKLRVLERTASGTREVDLVRPVTIRDLFTHTAGLTYHFLEDSPVSEMYRQAQLGAPANTLEAMIGELTRVPLAFQPGTRWHYSVAIDVIAYLIEILSGQPLQQFLAEHLFEPLGMSDTGFSVAPEKRDRIATMYGNPDVALNSISQIFMAAMNGFNERIPVDETYPADNTHSFARGGHGLFSTSGDYLRFAQMLLNRGELDKARILSPKIVDFMHLNHLSPALLPMELAGQPSLGYGFGLGSRVLLNPAAAGLPGSVGEYGWGGAAKTYFWEDPKEDMVGILMAQYMMGFDLPERDFYALAYQALNS